MRNAIELRKSTPIAVYSRYFIASIYQVMCQLQTKKMSKK